MKSQMKEVDNTLKTLGTQFWREFSPSLKSYNANRIFYDGACIKVDEVRREYMVSTIGLITWLLTWAQSRHLRVQKVQAGTMLEALLQTTLDAKNFFAKACFAKFGPELDQCVMRCTQGKPCRHVLYAFRLVNDKYYDWHWRNFVEMLGDLLLADSACGSIGDLFNRMLHNIADHINQRVLCLDAADPLKDTKILKTPLGKRRRLDEDTETALGQIGVASGPKSTSVVKLFGIGSDRLSYDVVLKYVKETRQAAQSTLTCTGVVCMTDDGSGHGKPSESTLLSIVWDAGVQEGCPGQPIVPNYQLWIVLLSSLTTATIKIQFVLSSFYIM